MRRIPRYVDALIVALFLNGRRRKISAQTQTIYVTQVTNVTEELR